MLEIAQSIDAKVAHGMQHEDFLSWLEKQSTKLGRYEKWSPINNAIAVIGSPESLSPTRDKYEVIKKWIYGVNIVTNDGDIFYANQAVTEAPAANEDFEAGRLELQNPGIQDTPVKGDTYTSVTTPITASRKVFDATYPKRNDGDADNTGAGVDVASYLVSYTTGDFNATGINGGAIHDNASPVGATKLLTHFSITSFNKTASDTLKMFINHTMNGV